MSEPILKLEKITKIYPNGVVANKDIDIEFEKGEIHAICGENGAGKSTLMKIIFRIARPRKDSWHYYSSIIIRFG